MKTNLLSRMSFSLLLSVLSLLTIKAERVEIGGLVYNLEGINATVYCVAGGNTDETIEIPSTVIYEGLTYTVNCILSKAFCNYANSASYTDGQRKYGASPKYDLSSNHIDIASNNSYVRSIVLPNTIEKIEDGAFYNTNLKDIILQEGLNSIGRYAFGETCIKEIILPSTVTSIDSYAFYKTKITRIVIPSSVATLGAAIFSQCDLLRTIVYLGSTPPTNWVATSQTYVPSLSNYSNPTYSINSAQVFSMINWGETEFGYSGNKPSISWTNNIDGYNASFTEPVLKSDVGVYSEIIPVTFTNGEESFTADIPYQYTINPAILTAIVDDANRTYGDANPDFKITYSGFVNGEDESVISTMPKASTTAKANSAVGTYPITISGGTASNYTFNYEQGILTVDKAQLSIKVNDANRTYGTSNPTFALSYTGLKNGETAPTWTTSPTFTTTATKASDAGSYSVSMECDPKNYSVIDNQPGTLTVTKAPLTIKANNASMTYGDALPTFGFTYTGFMNGDDVTALSTLPFIATTATAASYSGIYTITPYGAVAKNYDFTYTAGSLNIKQRPLTVKALSASRLYGENNPTFTLEYDGFVNNETKNVLEVQPTASTTATVQSGIGTYAIKVSGGKATNYSMTYEDGQLSITPRALKASVGNYERPYGEDNPSFAILYEGLAGNDTENSLSTKPVVRTNATKTSDVGAYDIEVTGGYSPNYNLSYGSGKLTVVKAEQTFEWNQDLSNLEVGTQIELLATASSGLPVTYIMEENDCAEIYKAGSKTYMECKAAGAFSIKAVQEGGDNYYSTQRINKKVTIVGEGEYNPTLIVKQSESGAISTKVEKGSTHTFTIYVENGWKIHSVMFNDEEVTEHLDEDNRYTTPAITESSTLRVVYESTGENAINSAKPSKVKIQATDFGARILNANRGDVVKVYTADGVLINSEVVTDPETDVELPDNNTYIIKVADLSVKVMR